MKKISFLAILTIFVMCLIMSGCSSQNNESKKPSYAQENISSDIPSLKEIEITLENWDTYFEFVQKEKEYINDYNETEHIKHYYDFVLKDEFVMSEGGTDINLEYSYRNTRYSVTEDLTNKCIVWGEQVQTLEENVVEEIEIKYSETGVAGEVFVINGDFKNKCTDFKVLRIYGTLSILE